MDKNYAESKRVGRGILSLSINKFIFLILGIVYAIIIPRTLGPESFGIFSFWLSIFFIMYFFLEFGAGTTITRYIPQFKKEKKDRSYLIIQRSLLIKLPLILLLMIIPILFLDNLIVIGLIVIATILFSINNILQRYFYAHKKMFLFSSYTITRRTFRIITIPILFLLTGIVGALLGLLITELIILLIYLKPFFKIKPKKIKDKTFKYWNYLKLGLSTYLSSFLSLANSKIAVILSVIYTNFTITGLFGFASEVLLAIKGVMMSMAEGITPNLIEYHIVKNPRRFIRSFILGWRYLCIIIFWISPVLFIYSSFLISTFIGGNYLGSANLIQVLIIGSIFSVLSKDYFNILLVYEKKRAILISNIIEFSVFMVLAVITTPYFGIISLAWSLVCANITAFLYIQFKISKETEISFPAKETLKPLFSSIPMFIIFLLMPSTNIIMVGLSIMLGTLAYISSLFLLKGLEKEDIARFLYIFK